MVTVIGVAYLLFGPWRGRWRHTSSVWPASQRKRHLERGPFPVRGVGSVTPVRAWPAL